MVSRDTTDLIGLLIVGGLAYYLYRTGALTSLLSGLRLPAPSGNGGGGSGSGGGGGGGSEGNYSVLGIAGDWQDSGDSQEVADAMDEAGVQYVLACGDYNDGGFESKTSKWSGKRRGAIGNHDSSGDLDMFEGQSGWNSATRVHPNVSVITIDTEDGIEESELDELTSGEIEKGSKFIIYIMHKPYVTASDDHHDGDENPSGDEIESVAKKYGVQLICNGHNHYYGRFKDGGTTYCTVGTAGGDSRGGDGEGGNGMVKAIKNTNGFLKVVVGSSLECDFVDTDGSSKDSFTISTPVKSGYVRSYYSNGRIPRSRMARRGY